MLIKQAQSIGNIFVTASAACVVLFVLVAMAIMTIPPNLLEDLCYQEIVGAGPPNSLQLVSQCLVSTGLLRESAYRHKDADTG
jgi:hypothetical protein